MKCNLHNGFLIMQTIQIDILSRFLGKKSIHQYEDTEIRSAIEKEEDVMIGMEEEATTTTTNIPERIREVDGHMNLIKVQHHLLLLDITNVTKVFIIHTLFNSPSLFQIIN